MKGRWFGTNLGSLGLIWQVHKARLPSLSSFSEGKPAWHDVLQNLFKTLHHPKDHASQQRGGGPWRTSGKLSKTSNNSSNSNAGVGAAARVGVGYRNRCRCRQWDGGGGMGFTVVATVLFDIGVY